MDPPDAWEPDETGGDWADYLALLHWPSEGGRVPEDEEPQEPPRPFYTTREARS